MRVRDAVAYGAVKYADLSNSRIGDYVFSFDRMLRHAAQRRRAGCAAGRRGRWAAAPLRAPSYKGNTAVPVRSHVLEPSCGSELDPAPLARAPAHEYPASCAWPSSSCDSRVRRGDAGLAGQCGLTASDPAGEGR